MIFWLGFLTGIIFMGIGCLIVFMIIVAAMESDNPYKNYFG